MHYNTSRDWLHPNANLRVWRMHTICIRTHERLENKNTYKLNTQILAITAL